MYLYAVSLLQVPSDVAAAPQEKFEINVVYVLPSLEPSNFQVP
jgi:hypothetical protein